MISKKKLRKLVKTEVHGHVTAEAIEFLQLHVEDELRNLCRKAVEEQQRMNSLYEQVGLPPKKRLGVAIFKKLSFNFICKENNADIEVEGQYNVDTSISRGKEMIETKKAPSRQDEVV
jgi:hypothetical protein